MAKITYGLVILAFVTLIIGFFQESSNAFLYVSIALSVLAIGFVVVGVARRAKEAPSEEEFEAAFDESAAPLSDEIPADLLSPFDADEDEEEEIAAEDDEEEFADEDLLDEDLIFDDEEGFADEEEEEERIIPARRQPARQPAKRPAAKSTTRTATRAKPAAKQATRPSAAKTPAKARTAGTGKVIIVPGRDRYHSPACRFIQGKGGTEEVSAATAKRRGYQPCSACKPG